MAKQIAKTKYLEVAVYWGGNELGRYIKPFASCRGVSAGKGIFSNIRSKVWPRWDDLEIFSHSRSGLILNPNLPWDGVIADAEGVHLIGSLRPQKKIMAITSQSSGSLRLDELTVLFRIGPKSLAKRSPAVKQSRRLASPLAFIAERREEWFSLTLGALSAAIILGAAAWSLSTRPIDNYTSLDDLPDENLLPFISQFYLATAPNIIQSGLDRFHYTRSVWNFYSALASTLGFGADSPGNSQLFPSTVDYYKNLSQDQSVAIRNAESAQSKKLSHSLNRGPVLSIPTVRGESLDGRTQRIFDKIGIVAQNADELVGKRSAVAEKFESDIGYKFEERKERNQTQEAFAKISAGFMGVESDDKMQAKQALDSAARAALIQSRVFGRERLVFGVRECCSAPAGSPLTQDGLTWIQPDLAGTSESSLSEFKASTWGTAGHKSGVSINEPKSGKVDPAGVEKTVAAGRYQLRLCYEMALRRNKMANGSMEWKWIIDSKGRASRLDLISSSINDEDLVRCVREKIASWHFPSPVGGSVEVRYPFEFSKDKG